MEPFNLNQFIFDYFWYTSIICLIPFISIFYIKDFFFRNILKYKTNDYVITEVVLDNVPHYKIEVFGIRKDSLFTYISTNKNSIFHTKEKMLEIKQDLDAQLEGKPKAPESIIFDSRKTKK